MYPRVVIAGERSGCGKTTVSLALMSVFSSKGLAVQGFKTGPDYIDTSHYEARTGRKGRNIDLWMTDPGDCVEIFRRNAAGRISVIEGVMGLYDGAYPDGAASTAHTAKLLDAPVIVVLDGARGGGSIAATALGLKMFDEEVNIAGFILNRISPRRAAEMAKTVACRTGIAFLGFLPPDDDMAIRSRHLGLVPASESAACSRRIASEAAIAEKSLDIELIEKIARAAPSPGESAGSLYPPDPLPQRVRLAVARDKAFSFYYEDSLDLLSMWGCEVAEFSPVSDESLPPGADAVFLGGGFPELYCGEIEENVSMRRDLLRFCNSGGAVYGECGGMMYLGRSVTDMSGRKFEMSGVFPAEFEMRKTLQSLGYREVVARADAGFFRAGDMEKGHEFHYSGFSPSGADTDFFNITKSSGGCFDGGMSFKNTVASYVHLNFLSSGIAELIPQRIKPAKGETL